MVVFTKTDKALLDRSARHLHETAIELQRSEGPVWSATESGKKAKKVFDRLLRDERDLRELAKRLEETLPTLVYPAGSNATELKTGAGG